MGLSSVRKVILGFLSKHDCFLYSSILVLQKGKFTITIISYIFIYLNSDVNFEVYYFLENHNKCQNLKDHVLV